MPNRSQQRRANFFKETRQHVSQAVLTEPRDVITAGPAVELSQAEKSLLVEQHLRTFEATLPPGTLSAGDQDNIRARAMMGPSSASAILTSVMQAVALVAPTHSKAAVNYYSGAAGVDAKTAESIVSLAARGGDPTLFRGGLGRDRSVSGEAGIGSLSRASTAGFGLDSTGALPAMSQQMYQQHFQSYYGASPQGQFTAKRVAGILAHNEGLSGEALVARTKEVARDTRDRLGLDTNIYAPKVANIGKKYSDPIIENKKNLDEAREAHKRGDTAAAERHERTFLDERKRQEDRARREDPSKAGDVAGVYNGLIVEAMRNGWVPTTKNAGEVFSSVIQSPDPDAKKRLAEMLEVAKKSPEGAAMVKKLEPLIEEQQRNAAQRREQETRAIEQGARAAETDKKAASADDDIDALVASAPATAKTKAAEAIVEVPGRQAAAVAPSTGDPKAAVAPAEAPQHAAAATPPDDKKPTAVAAAPPTKKPNGPTAAV